MALVGCEGNGLTNTYGQIEVNQIPLCESTGDMALVVGKACASVISQPDLPYPENSKEVEAWLQVEFEADPSPVVDGREACVPARPWTEEFTSSNVDCSELRDCLAGFGVVFPEPWIDGDYQDQATVCGDPSIAQGGYEGSPP